MADLAPDSEPLDTDSAVMRKLRRGRIGRVRIRFRSDNIIELDMGFPGGHRQKRFRHYRRQPTEALLEARRMNQEYRRHGQQALALTTGQRWVAAEAFGICDRLGVGLLDVVREFEKTHPHGANARTLDQVRIELVAAKAKLGRSEKHVASLGYRLRSLIEAIGNKPVTSITTSDLEGELERHPNWNPTTVHSAVQSWKIALNFAVRKGYLTNNPADRLELPRIVHNEPTCFEVTDVRRLMAATLFSDRHPLLPACRAYLAIGMFAGLRPFEIAKLEWRHVDLSTATIRVTAASAKDRDRRIVEVQPNLAEWLAPLVRRRGLVLAHPLDHLRAAARFALGLAEWPSDIMRHTFVSYHFAQFQNEAYTKKQVGHRDDGRVFYNHYMVPRTPADARRFWATVPPVGFLTA